MFDAVARRYDVTNDVLSLGPGPALAPRRHRRRRPAARRAGARPGRRHRHLQPALRRPRRPRRAVRLLARDAARRQAGPAAPAVRRRRRHPAALRRRRPSTRSTISFGLRNIVDPQAGLRELRRVTRPGRAARGVRVQPPDLAPLRTVYLEYLMRALPAVARAVSSSPDAYVYLAESIRAWPDQAGLAAMIGEAGWHGAAVAQPAGRHRRAAPRDRLSAPRARRRAAPCGEADRPGAVMPRDAVATTAPTRGSATMVTPRRP